MCKARKRTQWIASARSDLEEERSLAVPNGEGLPTRRFWANVDGRKGRPLPKDGEARV